MDDKSQVALEGSAPLLHGYLCGLCSKG